MPPQVPNFYMRKYNKPFGFNARKKTYAYINGKLTEIGLDGKPKVGAKPEQAKEAQ